MSLLKPVTTVRLAHQKNERHTCFYYFVLVEAYLYLIMRALYYKTLNTKIYDIYEMLETISHSTILHMTSQVAKVIVVLRNLKALYNILLLISIFFSRNGSGAL